MKKIVVIIKQIFIVLVKISFYLNINIVHHNVDSVIENAVEILRYKIILSN